MAELKRYGLTRKPENFAFFDPESRLHLTLARPVGTTPQVTAGIERGLKSGKIMDMDQAKEAPGVVLATPINSIDRVNALNAKQELPPVGDEDPNEDGDPTTTAEEDSKESTEAGQVEGEDATTTEETVDDSTVTDEDANSGNNEEDEEAGAPAMKYDAETLTDNYEELKALAKEEGINEKAKAKIVEGLLKIEA